MERTEIAPHGPDNTKVIGAYSVHLVDEGDLGNAVFIRLVPDGFGLRLHTTDSAEDDHRPIENPQAPLHLDGEIHMARVSMM